MTYQSVATQSFSIGQLIKEELSRQGRTVTWLARKINCDRRNIYNVFARTYIDTELLLRISLALHTDFFVYYSNMLQTIENQQITPPHYFRRQRAESNSGANIQQLAQLPRNEEDNPGSLLADKAV